MDVNDAFDETLFKTEAKEEISNLHSSICTIESFEAKNSAMDKTQLSFFYFPPSYADPKHKSIPDFLSLARSVESYKNEASKIISSLQEEEDNARNAEFFLRKAVRNPNEKEIFDDAEFFSTRIREKIVTLSQLIESDIVMLQQILKPFHIVKALEHQKQKFPSRPQHISNEIPNLDHRERRWTLKRRKKNTIAVTSTYDSVVQVITHMARDWTNDGAMIRYSLYKWCIEMADHYTKAIDSKKKDHSHMDQSSSMRVLVPGAALGRLAHDLSLNGFIVEANECSLTMAAAANQILNEKVRGSFHPFTFDYFVNEINPERRYEKLYFPDCEFISSFSNLTFNNENNDTNNKSISNEGGKWGELSYTIGDFVEIYTTPERRNSFDVLVTCFFIDTATNIYEYLATIQHLLRHEGIWINVGPVQWHRNALIRPSVEDLRFMIEKKMGWDILLWEIDQAPLQYRSDRDGDIRYTKMEAYHPLRFVARKPACDDYEKGFDSVQTWNVVANMREQMYFKTSQDFEI